MYQSVFHQMCSIVQKQKQFLWIMHQKVKIHTIHSTTKSFTIITQRLFIIAYLSLQHVKTIEY